MTIWIDSAGVNGAEDMKIAVRPGESVEQEAARLAGSPAQRILSRAVYTELYERTLRDCLAGSDDAALVDEVVRVHAEAVSRMRASIAPLARLIDRIRSAFAEAIAAPGLVALGPD